ncbi:glutathione S-transferase [Rhodobacterales bacterium HKCCE3408]|nr:glutathione S-transferase [Rhodobacterales bacterium HKCCE3408]
MITLHHVPESRSMRILWLLNEMGVDFDVHVWPFDKTLRSAQYLALNPAGRVPALELDGDRHFESGALIEILCERFPETGLGRPPGDPERAAWLTWIHFAETISQHSAALTQQHIALREDHMRSPIVMKLEAARLGKCYDAVEGRLEGRDYLLDTGFSAADIAVGQAIYMACHFARLEAHDDLAAWYARITDRPGFRASLPAGEDRLYRKEFYDPWPV